MAAAQDAAVKALADAGMPDPRVLINVSWAEGEREFIAGGAIPSGISRAIADPLRAVADELDSAGAKCDRDEPGER